MSLCDLDGAGSLGIGSQERGRRSKIQLFRSRSLNPAQHGRATDSFTKTRSRRSKFPRCRRNDAGNASVVAVVLVHGQLIPEMAETLFDGITRKPRRRGRVAAPEFSVIGVAVGLLVEREVETIANHRLRVPRGL